MSLTHQCTKCFKFKPIKDFPYNPEMKNKYENRCIDCKLLYNEKWRKNNPDKLREYTRTYDSKVRDGERPHRYQAKKLRIRNSMIVSKICHKQKVRESTFMKWFGCSSKVFIARFEREFAKNPGMGWHNYGAWQMDHIKPMKEFALDTEASRKLCNHYTNLRPEWATTNMKKGAKYAMEQKI